MNGHLISWFDVETTTTEIGLIDFINRHQMRWGKKPENILLSCKDFEQFSRNLEARKIFFGSKREVPITAVNIYGVDIQPSSIIARGIATQVLKVPIYNDLLKAIKEDVTNGT